jgi:hypothetical protein
MRYHSENAERISARKVSKRKEASPEALGCSHSNTLCP